MEDTLTEAGGKAVPVKADLIFTDDREEQAEEGQKAQEQDDTDVGAEDGAEDQNDPRKSGGDDPRLSVEGLQTQAAFALFIGSVKLAAFTAEREPLVAVVQLILEAGEVELEIARGSWIFFLPVRRLGSVLGGWGGGQILAFLLGGGMGAVVEGLIARHGGFGEELLTVDEYPLLAVHRRHLRPAVPTEDAFTQADRKAFSVMADLVFGDEEQRHRRKQEEARHEEEAVG